MRFILLLVLFLNGITVWPQDHQWVEFESIGFDRYTHPLIKVTKDGKQYYYHWDSDVLADDTENSAGDMIVVMKDGQYGVARRKDGKLIVPFEYDKIHLETDYYGQWYEGIPYHYKLIKLRKDGRYGLANEEGRIIMPPKYAEIDVLNKHFIGFREDNLWGWFDPQSGTVMQQPIYDELYAYTQDEYVSVVRDDMRGLATKDGTVVIPLEHTGFLRYVHARDQVFVFGNRIEAEANKRVLYDLEGNIKLTGFSELGTMYHADWLTFVRDGLTGAVNPLTGDIVLKPIYDRIESGVRGRFKVQKDGLWGVVDEEGKLVVPVAYSNLDFINVDNETKGSTIPRIDSGIGPPLPQDEWQITLRNYRGFMDNQAYFIQVEHEGGRGLFDWAGTMLASPDRYDAIRLTFHKAPYLIARNKHNTHIAILDSTGRVLDEFPYQQGDNYQYNNAIVQYDWEIGNRFIPFIHPSSGDSYTDQIALYDLEAENVVVPMGKQRIEWVDDRYFKVREIENDKISLYTREGEAVVSFEAPIEDLFVVGNNHVLVIDGTAYRLATMDGDIVYDNPQWSTRNSFMSRLFPEIDGVRTGVFHHGLMKLYGKEGNLFLNEDGEEVRFDGYAQVDEFYQGTALAAVEVADDATYQGYSYRYGLIDMKGNEIRPVEWESVSAFPGNPDWLRVIKDGKQGLVDRQGSDILEPVYDHIGTLGDGHNFEITTDDKVGLVAKDGTVILEPRYDRFHRNYEGKDRTWPLIAQEGEWYVLLDENGQYLPARARRYVY